MQHNIVDVEDFFSSYANSVVEMPDHEALVERFQGAWQGFYVEIIEINWGAFFLLSIAANDDWEWNVMEVHPRLIPSTGRTLYRFETLGATLEALADFQRVTISASSNVLA